MTNAMAEWERTPDQLSMIRLDQVQRMLAEEIRVDPIRDLAAKARAMEVYAKQRSLGLAAQNLAAEVRIRAERRLGEIILAGRKAKGTRGQLAGRDASGGSVTIPPEGEPIPSYGDLGISKREAALARWFARVPPEPFGVAMTALRSSGAEITIRTLRAAIREAMAGEATPEPESGDGKLLDAVRRALRCVLAASALVGEGDVAQTVLDATAANLRGLVTMLGGDE